MEDRERALEALRKVAGIEAKKAGLDKKVENKAKLELNQLGIDPESAAKSAALSKIIYDASQGRFGHNFGGFNVEAQMTPEERRIKLGWKKSF